MSLEDMRRYKLLIRDYDTPVDVHPFVAGATFEGVFERSEQTELEGIPFRVPAYGDLVGMKRAAGRTKDLDDLRALEAARQKRLGS